MINIPEKLFGSAIEMYQLLPRNGFWVDEKQNIIAWRKDRV